MLIVPIIFLIDDLKCKINFFKPLCHHGKIESIDNKQSAKNSITIRDRTPAALLEMPNGYVNVAVGN